jgi:hypothetical protein
MKTAAWTILSSSAAMPSGRCLPSAKVRRDGSARYAPVWTREWRSERFSSSPSAYSVQVISSTPGAADFFKPKKLARRTSDTPNQRCYGHSRHPACNEAPRCRTCDGKSTPVSRCEEGVTIAERQISVALTRHAASPNINAEQEIALAILSSPTWSYCVAQTGKCSRYYSEPWQRPLRHIDVDWIIRQRFEWLDRVELRR